MPAIELMDLALFPRFGDKEIGLRIVTQVDENGQATAITNAHVSDLSHAEYLLHDDPERCVALLNVGPLERVELRGELALAHIRWIKAGRPIDGPGCTFGSEGYAVTPFDWWRAVKAGKPERFAPIFQSCTFNGVSMPEHPVAFAHDPQADCITRGSADVQTNAEVEMLRAVVDQQAKAVLNLTGRLELAKARIETLTKERDYLLRSCGGPELAEVQAACKRAEGQRDFHKSHVEELKQDIDRLYGRIEVLTKERDDLARSVVTLQAIETTAELPIPATTTHYASLTTLARHRPITAR